MGQARCGDRAETRGAVRSGAQGAGAAAAQVSPGAPNDGIRLNNLPQTSGINLELLGLVEREQPGVLEMQRKKAGYAILAMFFDSLRRYRKTKGRLRLYFIQNYISDGRLIRIKGKDSTMKYVPLVREKDRHLRRDCRRSADVAQSEGGHVGHAAQMMPMLAKLNVPPDIWSTIIEYSPLPSCVRQDQ